MEFAFELHEPTLLNLLVLRHAGEYIVVTPESPATRTLSEFWTISCQVPSWRQIARSTSSVVGVYVNSYVYENCFWENSRNSRMKMRCVVLTGMILTVAAQPQIAKEQASMQAKIESQRYCQVDHKTVSLVITFGVAFKNSTGATITMRQPIHVVPLVSRTLQDLQHRNYEFTLYSPDVFS